MSIAPAKSTYESIWNSIDRMTETSIKLKIYFGTGRKRKLSQEMTGNIMSFAGRVMGHLFYLQSSAMSVASCYIFVNFNSSVICCKKRQKLTIE
jgi:hypothetical protein